MLVFLFVNIRLGQKGSPGKNTVTNLYVALVTNEKSFITLEPGVLTRSDKTIEGDVQFLVVIAVVNVVAVVVMVTLLIFLLIK
jgi:hypothetical protein